MMIQNKGSLSKLLKYIFVIGLSCYFVYYNVEKPRVLIVHSYALDYSWVKSINEGMSRVFGNRTDFSTHWQYMNTKNHPSIGYRQKIGVLVRRMISRLQPSVIIAIDDDAQDFVAKFYVDDPNIAVVFCGVNADLDAYGYRTSKNVTGILERVPFSAIKSSLKYLVKPGTDINNIKMINIGDESGTVRLDSILVDTFDRWKQAVLSASKRADCLLITNYRQLRRNPDEERFVPPTEVIDWTLKNATIPVIGGNGFLVEDGAPLAIGASPYEQGEVAAQMALQILDGTQPSQIPTQVTRNFLIYMRKNTPQHFTDGLPDIYEAFARGIGKLY
jgi:ABC-type uncharacterized transport system substrate-binding protein